MRRFLQRPAVSGGAAEAKVNTIVFITGYVPKELVCHIIVLFGMSLVCQMALMCGKCASIEQQSTTCLEDFSFEIPILE